VNSSIAKLPDQHNFSLAFEQMIGYVVITRTRDLKETLGRLILQCLVVFPDERPQNPEDIAQIIQVLCGLSISHADVTEAIDRLIKERKVIRPTGTNYVVALNEQQEIRERIEKAHDLEAKVKDQWLTEIASKYPTLNPNAAWKALRVYLMKAFRRHGIQAVAILNPSINTDGEHVRSLRSLLEEAVREACPSEQRNVATSAISDLMAQAGSNLERATYISQLADGAYSFSSLAVAPEVADQLRQNLEPLTLFLDTNFLFGILDLHNNPLVEVSNELLKAIDQHRLPFTLRYHQSTETELNTAIAHYEERLRSCTWSQSISRVAATSRYLSGIELKYHERNAMQPVDVDTFLSVYRHLDVLLQGKGIEIYKTNGGRLTERANLFHEYRDYLQHRGRDKPDSLIEHDMTVLDAVQQLRSDAMSSLQAAALIVTCDFSFYGFDWESSRRKGGIACVTLPNLFLQILRPFLPSHPDFDRSFAESFAIPEFRTIGSGAAEAVSKLFTCLAAYKDFPEETARKIASNDLLIRNLRAANSDDEIRQQIESAIVTENAALLEEKSALEKVISQTRLEQKNKEQQLERERQEKEEMEKDIKEKDIRLQTLESEVEARSTKLATLTNQVSSETQAREAAEKRAQDAEQKIKDEEKLRLQQRSNIVHTVIGVGVSLLAFVLFELLVHYFDWRWLLDHPNSVALQGLVLVAFLLAIVGLFRPTWRTFCWGSTGIFAVLLLLVGLLAK
jgi:hypothetical protein